MSRIGNRILNIPTGIEVNVKEDNNIVTVKGIKGTLTQKFAKVIKIKVEGANLLTIRTNETKQTKQLHGTTNSLLQGMLIGLSEGFKKVLDINGVGYKASLVENKLNLSLGYSHLVEYIIPQNITVKCPKPTQIIITGINKQMVGQVAAEIRAYRKPEPYKGKGIKYSNETIIRKEGKAAGK